MARGGHAGGGRLFGVAADVGEHLNGQFGVRLGQRFHQPFRRQGPRALGHLFRHHRVVRAARDGRQSFATAPPTANRGWRAAVRTARGARAPQDHPRNGFSAYDTVRGGGQRVSWGGGRFSAGFGAGAGSGPPGRARTLGPPPGAAAATERGTLSRCFSSVSEPLTQQQGQFRPRELLAWLQRKRCAIHCKGGQIGRPLRQRSVLLRVRKAFLRVSCVFNAIRHC